MEAQPVSNGRHKKKRRKSSTHPLKEGKRSLSEGSKVASRKRDVSREPSTGSSVMSLDVRCACQYFQCDSLLPDKVSLVGTRSPAHSHVAAKRDHEYEPINPPPDNETFPSPPPAVHIIDIDQEAKYIQPISETDLVTSSVVVVQNEPSIKVEANDRSSAPAVTPGPTDVEPEQESTSVSDKPKDGPSKFQQALKQTTDQFKSKLHNIKKPHISMPDKSKFKKFKIEKPKFNFPKIPDTAKVNLPSFSLPRRKNSGEKRHLKERQLSTESNDGDSKKLIFDFSTYPRIFKKKAKTVEQPKEEIPDFATVPRAAVKKSSQVKSDTTVTWGGTDAIRIPLHSEESVDADFGEEREKIAEDNTINESQAVDADDREDSVERRMASSHVRYDEDIDSEDDYERETQDINRDDYLNRWDHGNFNAEPIEEYLQNYKNSQYKVTDLDSPDDVPSQNNEFNARNNNKETYSSGSSLAMQRVGGVLEEIDSDEFFLRQKGISQDNIEVGMLLSSEIREAFRMPDNALSKIHDLYGHEYDNRGSNQSLPESQSKRKPIKKPKRKKTPHTSQEQIPYAEESCDDDLETLPPSRPKRRSKRVHKHKNADVIPYQETIPLETNDPYTRLLEHRESLGILGDDEREIESNIMYENEVMQGKQQPEIRVTDPYRSFKFCQVDKRQHDESQMRNDNFEEPPAAPPRKQKSLRSLNLSENESITGDTNLHKYNADIEFDQNDTNIEPCFTEQTRTEYNSQGPPQRPFRMRSHTSSQSGVISQLDDESLSKEGGSLASDNQIPCVEEPCIKDIRDHMGYAIIDKNKVRDPPLPPPRLPARRKRSVKLNQPSDSDTKFFTVPRSGKDVDAPVRPLRNYSTLGQTRRANDNVTYENKENIDIIQYIEIEDEPNRHLQSGDIIKKMKDRPLPAPPRPPRKSRPLRDITSKENVMAELMKDEDGKLCLEESEVSTQTEPLPEDFVCEEFVPEVSDTIISPSHVLKSEETTSSEKPAAKPEENIFVERRLITPTYFTQEETITHGSLLIEPLNGSKILPDSELTTVSRERIIPITTDSEGETSSIPEDFKQLKNPSEVAVNPEFKDVPVDTKISQPTNLHNPEVSILKTQKLQVSDLDVDTLTVSKLMAEKIVVSEIDSGNIQTNEISSKSGALKVGEIELPPGVIQKIIESITSAEKQIAGSEETPSQSQESALKERLGEEKKTSANDQFEIEIEQSVYTPRDNVNTIETLQSSIADYPDVKTLEHPTDSFESRIDLQNEPPHPPPRSIYLEETEENIAEDDVTDECPQRPPRHSEKNRTDSNSNNEDIQELQQPDVDDEPPPRPPEPQLNYLPSQPPASFYALRAQSYVDTLEDNIPVVPRRRRQTKSKAIPRSSSEESEVTPVSRRHQHRTSEPSIPQLSGQLARACASQANNALKRLISHVTSNVLQNGDGKQDSHVMVIILLVLIAGLILLGYGDEKTVVHLHHWEYFNPPRDM